MKDLFELFSIFKSFIFEICMQFGIIVCTLHSDNACEYFSTSFNSFMSRQSTCPHTPQQNGVVERKNHHLVETACNPLLHANVPFHFWVMLF